MMENNANKHRDKIQTLLSEPSVYKHQRDAAQNTYIALNGSIRAAILAAEMQSGKSGVAMAIACYQRNSLSDIEICQPKMLKDTLYIMTMADISLLEQAKEDLKPAANVIVSNLTRFLADIEKFFRYQDPKLIIVDECHYGSGDTSIRYGALFDYIQNENTKCKVVFISATPLSALLAPSEDSLINRGISTKIVFHRTSDDYFGIREMLSANQVINLDYDVRNILIGSKQRVHFIKHFNAYQGEGWSLIRVPSGTAMDAKRYLASCCVPEDRIFILGKKLNGVPDDEHTSIEDFKEEFKVAMEFGGKVIAITVAGCRAGINFGFDMKSKLISTWDSTVSNVAAVVQANVGRACGYHSNQLALHFTNKDAVSAYGEVLTHLEEKCSSQATDNINGLRSHYEKICKKYHIKGFDVGASINRSGEVKARKKLNDAETYLIDSYFAIPAKLDEPDFDFSAYTNDDVVLKSIFAIRDSYLKDNTLQAKASRALRGYRWIKAHWVNGDTYDNPEKALASGTMLDRAMNLTNALDQGKSVEFNQAVTPGGNERSADKLVAVKVFSIYNRSRRNVNKKSMDIEDVHQLCSWFKTDLDNTLLLIFKRGDYCPVRSEEKNRSATIEIQRGPIVEGNYFQKQEEVTL